MSDKKTSVLPKLEMIIIGIFLVSFMIWAVSKCSRTRQEILSENPEEQIDPQQAEADSLARLAAKQDSLEAARRQAQKKTRSEYTPLYVTIDDLNVRNAPALDAEVVDQLPLFEEVLFLNEWTEFTTEVNLGRGMATEPWIKVRTPKGHEGWVFGAGVHYYKEKNPLAY
jgi:hypothetical protein